MYKPENQSQIGSLIQKIWSENQGHLTLHIFQQKKNLSLSIIIPSSFHFTSLHIFHSISLHSTSFFFQFIHSISFPPIKSLSGLFHSDKFVLIIFVQAEKCCCRFCSSYQVSAANTLCLYNQINSVSKRKIYSQRYHHQRAARMHSTYKARKQSKVSHQNQQRDQMQTYEGMFQIFNQQFNIIYAWFSNRGRSHLMQ